MSMKPTQKENQDGLNSGRTSTIIKNIFILWVSFNMNALGIFRIRHFPIFATI